MWLIAVLAIILATTFKAARRDLTVTRAAALVTPPSSVYEPGGLLPHLDGILSYLGNYAFEDTGPQWGVAAQPSSALTGVLQMNGEGKEVGKLIPNKRRLWHLLNEVYVAGDEAVPGEIYSAFGKSIFMSEPIHQEGLCDYIDRRVMPAIAEFLARGNYGAARRLVTDMMAWINALRPSPHLAADNPRLQAYVNFFLRLDALLNDPVTLYSRPIEAERIVTYVTKGETLAPSTITFLKGQGGELAAWGTYLAGQAALRRREFPSAASEFETAAKVTANPRLKDLANLGHARSLFWGAKVDPVKARLAESKLAALKKEIRPSFRSDLSYYEDKLRRAP